MEQLILPCPKSIIEKNDAFELQNTVVCLVGKHDYRAVKAAETLRARIREITGTECVLKSNKNKGAKNIVITENALLKSESYNLEIKEDVIVIEGGDAAGCFYGIQTLLQLIDSCGSRLPGLSVNDSPDMAYRGFYHDATRGRVPSVDGIKKLIDRLAYYKINSLQLYVEHTFDFKEFRDESRTEQDCLTAEDILEIDAYCYDRFIDFVPSLSTFGHLYELLMRKEYSHLCELENFVPEYHFWRERQMHHTIDADNSESFDLVFSLIDQYLPLFRSEYFNICCDETFDLCYGRNAGKDKAKLYTDFVCRLSEHVTAMGKKVMMWGDIALSHPEALSRIPNDTVLLNWEYSPEPDCSKIVTVKERGLTQIACPGTSSWASLIEQPDISAHNISKMALYGYQNGALGLLNTNWGDYGHPASCECSYYGMLLGACFSWNVETEADICFETLASKSLYGVEENIIPDIIQLAASQRLSHWIHLFLWSKNHEKSVFEVSTDELQKSAELCDNIALRLSEIGGKQEVLEHIVCAAKGISLLNKAVVIILNDLPADEWHILADEWLLEYEHLWLTGSKQSELCEIKKFIKNII